MNILCSIQEYKGYVRVISLANKSNMAPIFGAELGVVYYANEIIRHKSLYQVLRLYFLPVL